jgi:hypothetical protein
MRDGANRCELTLGAAGAAVSLRPAWTLCGLSVLVRDAAGWMFCSRRISKYAIAEIIARMPTAAALSALFKCLRMLQHTVNEKCVRLHIAGPRRARR